MHLDPLFLSRLQWAWVIGWHILLPAFTVGCASYIAVLEGLSYWRGDPIWARMSLFWTRIFAVAFGMGVVTGIVMPFQFGTNWSRFSDATANVLSPMLAYEDLMAFFLEATFLGVLLFGRKLVPSWAHLLAACMVALGTLMSSFWILAANSWMQTPTRSRPARWPILSGGLVRHCLQSIFSVSLCPQRHRLLRNDRLRGVWRRCLPGPSWQQPCGRAAHGYDGARFPGGVRAVANLPWRPAGSQHSALPASEDRGDRGTLETAAPAPLTLFAIPEQAQARNAAAVEFPISAA